jgi:hypothetical protein
MREDIYPTYDGREHFVKELVDRAKAFLEKSPADPVGWYESLMDYFAFVSPALTDQAETLKKIRCVRDKIFAKRIGGRVLTEAERQRILDEAYDTMWELFIEMHCIVYNSGWYVPVSRPKDPNRAFADYYPPKPKRDGDGDDDLDD